MDIETEYGRIRSYLDGFRELLPELAENELKRMFTFVEREKEKGSAYFLIIIVGFKLPPIDG